MPTLARKTTVVGSESAYARVRLPKSVTFRKTLVEIEGDGRAVGVVLTSEVNGRVPRTPKLIEFDSVRLSDCFEEGCSPDQQLAPSGSTGERPRPGIYRLYLIADGAPASVTITFPELKGKTTIVPTSPSRTVVQTMTSWVSIDVTRSVYSAGDIAPFRGNGMAWMGQTIEAPGSGTAAYDFCIYWDEPPTVEATAYLPGCPKVFPGGPYIREYEESREDWLGFHLSLGGRIPAAIGNWYATTSPVDVGGSVAVWLKF